MNEDYDKATHALENLKILDMTRVLGGPYATQILADHGAEVIKIEAETGDETRGWGPPFRRGMASYFLNVNRNKKSIVIDLRHKAGRSIVLRLLQDTDVLIENFKTGTMEKWGLGYQRTLQEKFPKLIHCRISGFGADGPLGGAPGYDAILQAMTGMMSINGMAESGTVRMGAPMVDMGTGLYSVVGILMALLERQRSGKGQFIDMALYDSALALTHPYNANYFLSGKPGKAVGNSHPNISPYDKFKTRTNEIFLGIGNNAGFARLCRALGLSELASDPRFLTNADRVKNRDALNNKLAEVLADVDGAVFAEKLLAAGLPAGPVRDMKEALDHPHTGHRQMRVSEGWYEGMASPIKFSRSKSVGIRHVPPLLGEQTREVLAKAGYASSEIEELLRDGTVAENDAQTVRRSDDSMKESELL